MTMNLVVPIGAATFVFILSDLSGEARTHEALIDGDETMLERQPIERAVERGELIAYRHTGF